MSALDAREEAALAQRAASGESEALTRLLEANRPLILTLAGRLGATAALRDELVQAGAIGLMQAVHRFSPDAGARLTTYAVPWMLGEMKRTLRRALDGTGAGERYAALERAGDALREQLGRAPRLGEVAAACGMDAWQAAQIELLAHPLSVEGGEGLALTVAVGIDEERLALRIALDALPDEERRVILLRYFRDATQQETARMLGKSQAQVSRIERRVLDALRAALS